VHRVQRFKPGPCYEHPLLAVSNLGLFRLVECPLSVRPDIQPGPMSADCPKVAVREAARIVCDETYISCISKVTRISTFRRCVMKP
jgi:hypothetical protein